MKRWHDMPFGTKLTAQGVRFRLWAPGCESVSLCMEGREPGPGLRMQGTEDGWFELLVPDASVGTRYGFEVSGGLRVPDPASRYNPDDVHSQSEVIDPTSFDWQDESWRGRPWEEAVIYELHVGAFSPEGSFEGVRRRLDYLVGLGITAIELMPVADFPGACNWGYDGVLPFAPDSRYGRPEELKLLVQAAHAQGLMVLLDVVYNHFGPEGNYLWVYAKQFFTARRHTAWGDAINFDGPGSREIRQFFIHNALFWLSEYHFDGLRLDAVHAIADESGLHILSELAQRVHTSIESERQVHLVLENDANQARYLGHRQYAAQWNDDFHHALHVLLTGETDGYYLDYADQPIRYLGRCLSQGFAYQGELSAYRGSVLRGEASAQLPPQAFVSFLQSHDQIGNRAFGERIHQLAPEAAVRAAAAVYLLAPGIPLLFMGEEFAAPSPFLFFCDFGEELRNAVTLGRRREFAAFAKLADRDMQSAIPDPNQQSSFLASKLAWGSLNDQTHARWLAYYRRLLQIRHDAVTPRLRGMPGYSAGFRILEPKGLQVAWRLGDGSTLHLNANLSPDPVRMHRLPGDILFATSDNPLGETLGPWTVVWSLESNQGTS